MSINSAGNELRSEMQKLGAREFEIVSLSADPVRGLAALHYAYSKNAENPIPYAIKVYDNADWNPSGEKRRVATNLSVETQCEHCGGDRFVLVSTRPVEQSGWGRDHNLTPSPDEVYEEYAPCSHCNADANTARWTPDGTRLETAPR